MIDPSEEDLAALNRSGLFDADWYARTYADVGLTGMDPATHFLKYGNLLDRDPGPEVSTTFLRIAHGLHDGGDLIAHLTRPSDEGEGTLDPLPGAILYAAHEVSLRGEAERAVTLAERHLPKGTVHTAHVLRANARIQAGDDGGWCESVNAYLAHYGAEAIALAGEGAVFDRLVCPDLPPVTGGPLVSVIMPAWNAEATVEKAARSVLDQTWRNLELLIVDDASDDGTWAVLQRLAQGDDRVRIVRNTVNVGPYASKNRALDDARGDWITGHDADDWAHPSRLARHLAEAQAGGEPLQASSTFMIRMRPDGIFDTFCRINDFSPDGVTRKSSISTLFQRDFLVGGLGHWDSVRFGADSEMIARASRLLGRDIPEIRQIGMICLSTEQNLTNHPEHGIRTRAGFSRTRAAYRDAWLDWHAQVEDQAMLRLPIDHHPRRFAAPEVMLVDLPPGLDQG